MAQTDFRGPLMSMGALEVESGSTATIQPFDGPSGSYQGYALLDPRAAAFNKDAMLPGAQPAFLISGDLYTVDNVPQAASTTLIAPAATLATAATALTMTLASTGVAGTVSGNPVAAFGVPLVPLGTTTITTANIVLDFGFATGTTVANSSTVVVNDSTLFTRNQWITIGNAGASNKSAWFTQVQSITNATTIQVSPVPPATATIAPIGGANLFGSDLLPPSTQFGPSNSTANAWQHNLVAGFARVRNPREMIARNLTVSLVTGGVATSATFLVSGWDVWNQPMTELITVPGTTVATTAFGRKAFKSIQSVIATVSGTTNTYSVGVGDVFGFPIRADEWEQTSVYWNGCAPTTSLGFTAATTVTATNTSGDVRGSIQVSSNGTGTAMTISTAAVSNGTSRLVMVQNAGIWNLINATPLNSVPLFGVTQA